MGLFSFVFLITIVLVLSKPIDINNIKKDEVIELNTETKILEVNKNFTAEFRNDAAFVNQIRPGMAITSTAVEIDINGNSFTGYARIVVSITDTETRDEAVMFYFADLEIQSVRFSILSGSVQHEPANIDIDEDDGTLEIEPGIAATSYTFHIVYGGSFGAAGKGLYMGHYGDGLTYVAMNLHPTYARRVFPCMDEPTELASVTFTFNNLEYANVVLNSQLEENSATQFRPLNGPPHLWGLIAHNFPSINMPVTNVWFFGRSVTGSQEGQASVAINSFYTNLNEWTNKEYTEIVNDQRGTMNIVVVPDVATDWHALSSVAIWEPYVFMEPISSVKQRVIGLPKLAEAMARQWFGYVIFPQNWRYEWVVSGLATYAGWEMFRMFQGDGMGTDTTLLDVNTLFTTEVIQESLLRDSYTSTGVLEPGEDLFDEDVIRDHIGVNGIMKYKAPALMRMMRVVLGDPDHDYIQMAASALVNGLALEWVTTLNFIDAVNSEWFGTSHTSVVDDDFDEYLNPWIQNNGYPMIRVTRVRGSGVLLTQERFGFSNKPFVAMKIPITYTTSIEQNFDIERIYPVEMFDQSHNLVFALGDEDWVLFNIQGQGYYRVNYELELWDIIIEALEDPETREQIHPLNRATLIDDALNIARAGRLDYDYAFRLVLTMEHETEYAPWKAFVRNMDFLRKRLVAYVDDDEDLDPDIYLRMVRRTIHAFEDQIGFYPDVGTVEPVMQTLTRGLVMEHACRARYQPCIAAAVDWFYDPNNAGVVNPNIPHEIRPAVYCTMVKEGDEEVIEALEARLEIEPTHYERIVILEALACSQDEAYINGLLDRTIAADSPYLVEERVKIFNAIAESSYQNADIARAYLRMRTSEIRDTYGGPEKLEEVFFVLADNMADPDQIEQFHIWANGQNNNLDDSQDAAFRALAQMEENLIWDERDKEYVYEWIDENDAPRIVLSVMAFCVSFIVAFLIQ